MSTGAPNKNAPGAGQHADGPRLLADIGGTNARFALETGPGEIGQVRVYPCAQYPGVAEVIQQYLKDN
ncbi:glucokinase, partial [Paraburkholderia sp. BR14261]